VEFLRSRASANSFRNDFCHDRPMSPKWRFLLPPAQFALHWALLWYGCPYRPIWQRHLGIQFAQPEDITSFDTGWISGPMSAAEQLAMGLNFPATLAAQLSLGFYPQVFQAGSSSDLAVHIATAIFLLPLWYWIGRRVDQGDMASNQLSAFKRGLMYVALIVLAMIGAILLVNAAAMPLFAVVSVVWIAVSTGTLWASLRRPLTPRPQ